MGDTYSGDTYSNINYQFNGTPSVKDGRQYPLGGVRASANTPTASAPA